MSRMKGNHVRVDTSIYLSPYGAYFYTNSYDGVTKTFDTLEEAVEFRDDYKALKAAAKAAAKAAGEPVPSFRRPDPMRDHRRRQIAQVVYCSQCGATKDILYADGHTELLGCECAIGYEGAAN